MVVDGDLSYLFECIRWYHMIIKCFILISLSRSGPIGQDEVELHTCTTIPSVFKANELTNRPRLEPLFEDRGFSLKLKPASSVCYWTNNL